MQMLSVSVHDIAQKLNLGREIHAAFPRFITQCRSRATHFANIMNNRNPL